jgi:hypothetical protein
MEKNYLKISGKFDSNINLDKFFEALKGFFKMLLRWFLPFPIAFALMHPITSEGVYQTEKNKPVESIQQTNKKPDKKLKQSKKKDCVRKKRRRVCET